ncbi:hypothetical protein Are01nite_88070 [Actinoplanes regularis]|nr:hypothetical protein Are01nite_88070 [Actinoplanes regularis]
MLFGLRHNLPDAVIAWPQATITRCHQIRTAKQMAYDYSAYPPGARCRGPVSAYRFHQHPR